MECTIEEYIEDAKSQLCCNNDLKKVGYITYNYTNEEIDNNKEYFKYCLNENLSAYKALLFFHDYLEGEFNIKSYQIVYKKED